MTPPPEGVYGALELLCGLEFGVFTIKMGFLSWDGIKARVFGFQHTCAVRMARQCMRNRNQTHVLLRHLKEKYILNGKDFEFQATKEI